MIKYDLPPLTVTNSSHPCSLFQSDLLGTDWHYSVEWYGGSSHRQRSAVVITSEPSPADRDFPSRGIEIEVWTNSEVASDIITAQHPLAVFAKVSMRNGRNTPSPVLEAMVTVEVRFAM